MKNKKIVITGLALLTLGIISSPMYVEAAGNAIKSKMNGNGEKTEQRFKNHPEKASTTPEQFQEMRAEHQAKADEISQALKDGDYDAWLALVGVDSPMAEKITADNFSKVSEAYNLMEQARALLKDAGVEGNGFGMGMGMGFGMGRGEHRGPVNQNNQ